MFLYRTNHRETQNSKKSTMTITTIADNTFFVISYKKSGDDVAQRQLFETLFDDTIKKQLKL